MKLVVVAVGHRVPDWVEAGFREYARRMPRELPLSLIELKPESRATVAHAGRARDRLVGAEGRRISAAVPARALRVALDERGLPWSTRELAGRLAEWQMHGRDAAFLIGGADGLPEDVKGSADAVWSLSALTLPHALVRIILAEQLYRASSILRNHPYHRD